MDLIGDEWLAVMLGGKRVAVSLEGALARAHEFDGLADPVATVRVAVLRQVLLAVLLDALGVPRTQREWEERWAAARFDGGRIREYLYRHRERFRLFDERAPFAQVAGLTAANGQEKPASVIVPSVATGNNVPLFSTRTEADSPVFPPPDALRWLLNTQCWDTARSIAGASGDSQVRDGKTTGNPVGPLGRLGVVLPTGRSLFETLMLNTPVVPDGLHPDDAPQ